MTNLVVTSFDIELLCLEVQANEKYIEEGRQILEERGCFTVDQMSPEQLMSVALTERDRPW